MDTIRVTWDESVPDNHGWLVYCEYDPDLPPAWMPVAPGEDLPENAGTREIEAMARATATYHSGEDHSDADVVVE